MTAPFFGDFEMDDALDTAPPAPEQVAYRLHRYRRYLGQLAGADPGEFFDMTRREQDAALSVAERVVNWLADHDASERADLAEAIHEIRQADDPQLVDWWDQSDDLIDIAEAMSEELSDWLIREGAWR